MMCSKFIKYEGWTVEGPPVPQCPSVSPPQDKQQHLLTCGAFQRNPVCKHIVRACRPVRTHSGRPAHCLGTCLVEQLFLRWP